MSWCISVPAVTSHSVCCCCLLLLVVVVVLLVCQAVEAKVEEDEAQKQAKLAEEAAELQEALGLSAEEVALIQQERAEKEAGANSACFAPVACPSPLSSPAVLAHTLPVP